MPEPIKTSSILVARSVAQWRGIFPIVIGSLSRHGFGLYDMSESRLSNV